MNSVQIMVFAPEFLNQRPLVEWALCLSGLPPTKSAVARCDSSAPGHTGVASLI